MVEPAPRDWAVVDESVLPEVAGGRDQRRAAAAGAALSRFWQYRPVIEQPSMTVAGTRALPPPEQRVVGIFEHIAEQAGSPLDRGMRVLDFGAGAGRHVAEFRDAGYDAWGIDQEFASHAQGAVETEFLRRVEPPSTPSWRPLLSRLWPALIRRNFQWVRPKAACSALPPDGAYAYSAASVSGRRHENHSLIVGYQLSLVAADEPRLRPVLLDADSCSSRIRAGSRRPSRPGGRARGSPLAERTFED